MAARRRRRGGPGEEPPETGSAAVDPDADPETVARAIALRQLAAAPRTRAQLRETLAKRDVPEEVAERVLDRFEEVHLVDDAQYAEMWVRSRHRGRGLARRALAHELRERGVAPELTDSALERLDPEEEIETARSLIRRKLATTGRLDEDARMRRAVGMLARKGYPAGLALRLTREELDAEREDVAGIGDGGR